MISPVSSRQRVSNTNHRRPRFSYLSANLPYPIGLRSNRSAAAVSISCLACSVPGGTGPKSSRNRIAAFPRMVGGATGGPHGDRPLCHGCAFSTASRCRPIRSFSG